MRQQNSEQINLEYKVEFKDGLSPRLHVYGIDNEENCVYGADVRVGVSVGAGYHTHLIDKEVVEKKGALCGLSLEGNLKTGAVVSKYKMRIPENLNQWEQEMLTTCKKNKINIIKIQNPDHIVPAVDRHVHLYQNQFEGLSENYLELFNDFIKKHPIFGHFNF